MSLYPKYFDRTLYSNINLKVSKDEFNNRMRAFRIAKMIGEYWGPKMIFKKLNISKDLENLISPSLWFENEPQPLQWKKINPWQNSFTICL